MVPERYARAYLERAPSLIWLLCANLVAVLVGVRYYVTDMPGVDTFLWPFYVDSAVAVLLMSLSLATLLPNIGRRLDEAPTNLVLDYLYTITFVWLVKFGCWTIAVLLVGWDAYGPALWGFFGILITHALFVVQAYLLPHVGRTTRGALGIALGLALVNDVLDYVFGYHPPLPYDPGVVVIAIAVALSVVATGLAARAFDRSEERTVVA